MSAAYDLVDRSRATFGPLGWLGFNTSSLPGRPGEIKCRAGVWLQHLEKTEVHCGTSYRDQSASLCSCLDVP